MRIVILQLARLGDILQTLPAIQGLKKRYPGSKVTLVVRDSFADAARLSSHVDNLVEFSSRSVLSGYIDSPNAKTKQAAAQRLEDWLKDSFGGPEPFDLLFNLTFSRASSIMASIIPARKRLGIRLSKGENHVVSDPWSQFFFSQVLERNLNMLHLNDIFTRITESGTGAWPLDIREPKVSNPVAARSEGTLRIGIQMSASQPDKTLNHSSWKAVCSSILERHPSAQLVFFGAKHDVAEVEPLVAEIRKQHAKLSHDPCLVVAGTMRFHENIHWVRSCDWIVTPDTAIVHLASIAGTRIIEIPIGAVRPEETGPYGEGHHILYPVSCDGPALGRQIARVIAGEKAETCVAHAMTRFRKCVDGTSRSEIIPANFTPDETTNFFTKAYYLLAEFRCAGRQEDIDIPKLGDPSQPGALDRMVHAYDALCSIRRLAEFGQHYCMKMLRNMNDKTMLSEMNSKLMDVERMLKDLQKNVPNVKSLIDTWVVAKDLAYCSNEWSENGTGDSGVIERMIALTEGAYRELGQNVEIVQQLLQTAVKAAQERKQGAGAQKSASQSIIKEEV